MKILIVDDDELTLKAINHSLTEEGYKVILAEDVSKALTILEDEKIDLIISDIMMPNVSGLGLLSLLKNFYFDRIPVILISSLNKGDVVANSLGLGARYFLAKPVDLKELSTCIKNVFNKVEHQQ
jgi:DNA-binding response OmpR family regulator